MSIGITKSIASCRTNSTKQENEHEIRDNIKSARQEKLRRTPARTDRQKRETLTHKKR